MRLPSAPSAYNQRDQQTMRSELESEINDRVYRKREHLDLDPSTYIIMTSPDGTRYKVTMANGGTLTVASL